MADLKIIRALPKDVTPPVMRTSVPYSRPTTGSGFRSVTVWYPGHKVFCKLDIRVYWGMGAWQYAVEFEHNATTFEIKFASSRDTLWQHGALLPFCAADADSAALRLVREAGLTEPTLNEYVTKQWCEAHYAEHLNRGIALNERINVRRPTKS